MVNFFASAGLRLHLRRRLYPFGQCPPERNGQGQHTPSTKNVKAALSATLLVGEQPTAAKAFPGLTKILFL